MCETPTVKDTINRNVNFVRVIIIIESENDDKEFFVVRKLNYFILLSENEKAEFKK